MKIKLNESKTLEFNVDTSGCKEEELKGYLRFTFEGVEYGFPAIFESGTIKVEIPAFQKILSQRLTEGIYKSKEVVVKARMDIIANEEVYTSPWSGDIDIEIPVSISIKEDKDSNSSKEIRKKLSVSDPALMEAFDDMLKKTKLQDKLNEKTEEKVKVKIEEEKVDKEKEEEIPSTSKKSRFAQSLEETYIRRKE